ncbi:MAG: DUF4158 domain-containing protein [Gammaproteobacteria bacterium]|nr:DUF4158 domain-containing protein [Gammaproteobacteria bacterium]
MDQDDIEKLYAKPAFTLIEYGYYFMLPEVLLAEINSTKIEPKNISAKVYFILQYGYFKARHLFSKIDYKNSQEDVDFIVSHYFPEHASSNKLPTRKVQRQTKTKLLKHFEFSDNRKSIEKIIEEKVTYLAKTTAHLTLIFDGVLSELEQKKCVLPAYSKMQDLLGAALKKEDRRLSKTTKEALKNHTRVHAIKCQLPLPMTTTSFADLSY